jgi:GNAT superfamily N-acetyltransferase
MNYCIYTAESAQTGLFSDLAFRSKAHWGYTAEFMSLCKAELTYTAYEIENNYCYFLERDKQLVGFYILSSVNKIIFELDALFIEPTLIGNGYGGALLDHARKIAGKIGYRKIIIQSDPNSVDFYIAMGASQVGSKPSLSIPGRVLPMLEILI